MGKKIACKGDISDHGGIVVNTNQDDTLRIGYAGRAFGSGAMGSGTFGGALPAVEGALHSCPIIGHGVTSITAVTTKSTQNSELILTEEAEAGCGAKLIPRDRKVYIE